MLVANSSDLIAVLDAQGRVLYANPTAERMLGFTLGERFGRSALELIHPDDRDAITTTFREGIHQPGIHPSIVFRVKMASGDLRSRPCPVKWCKRGRRHPRVVRLVHAASVIAGTPSVSMVV
jgi:PAS domain S-box-containing protein